MYEFIVEQLQNQFFSGGLVLMMIGSAIAASRHVPARLWALAKRHLVMTVDISDQEEAFTWLKEWAGHNDYAAKSCLLSLSAYREVFSTGHVDSFPVGLKPLKVREKAVQGIKVIFSPAPGTHLLRFEGKWILLTRERKESPGTNNQFWRELIILRTLTRDRDFIRRLVEAAHQVSCPEEDYQIRIFNSRYEGWQQVTTRGTRGMNSVILPEGVEETLSEELEEFFGAGGWYRDRGIPYQRGYLLHGPPGGGKTSLVVALASKFKCNIYTARISGMTDDQFKSLVADMGNRSILLVEDVDCLYEGRNLKNNGVTIEGSNVTFSGFLNALDGIVSGQGRVLILTTNRPEILDDALIRPGRVDRKIELPYATESQAERLFLNFYAGEGELAKAFGEAAGQQDVSMADLQGILIANKKSPENAVREIVWRIRCVGVA
jgi:chaperone BCS1